MNHFFCKGTISSTLRNPVLDSFEYASDNLNFIHSACMLAIFSGESVFNDTCFDVTIFPFIRIKYSLIEVNLLQFIYTE